MTDWQLLYTTTNYTNAAIVKGRLEENDIPVQVLNKQDSMYVTTFGGSFEIYVPPQMKELATSLLSDTLNQ